MKVFGLKLSEGNREEIFKRLDAMGISEIRRLMRQLGIMPTCRHTPTLQELNQLTKSEFDFLLQPQEPDEPDEPEDEELGK